MFLYVRKYLLQHLVSVTCSLFGCLFGSLLSLLLLVPKVPHDIFFNEIPLPIIERVFYGFAECYLVPFEALDVIDILAVLAASEACMTQPFSCFFLSARAYCIDNYPHWHH